MTTTTTTGKYTRGRREGKVRGKDQEYAKYTVQRDEWSAVLNTQTSSSVGKNHVWNTGDDSRLLLSEFVFIHPSVYLLNLLNRIHQIACPIQYYWPHISSMALSRSCNDFWSITCWCAGAHFEYVSSGWDWETRGFPRKSWRKKKDKEIMILKSFWFSPLRKFKKRCVLMFDGMIARWYESWLLCYSQ